MEPRQKHCGKSSHRAEPGKKVLKRTMGMKQKCKAQLLSLWREQERQKTPGGIGAIEESLRVKNTVQRKVLSYEQ